MQVFENLCVRIVFLNHHGFSVPRCGLGVPFNYHGSMFLLIVVVFVFLLVTMVLVLSPCSCSCVPLNQFFFCFPPNCHAFGVLLDHHALGVTLNHYGLMFLWLLMFFMGAMVLCFF